MSYDSDLGRPRGTAPFIDWRRPRFWHDFLLYWFASCFAIGSMFLAFSALTRYVATDGTTHLALILSIMFSGILGVSLCFLLFHIIRSRGTEVLRTDLFSRLFFGGVWALGHFALCFALYRLSQGTALALADRYLAGIVALAALSSGLSFNVAVRAGGRSRSGDDAGT